ncbi:hypothetical protein P0D88_28240 [Paraburkholderia sp. RL18-103-BIB-C]|jgi:hypothetical protein
MKVRRYLPDFFEPLCSQKAVEVDERVEDASEVVLQAERRRDAGNGKA